MTSKEWEDICISFDEYGMQPATLCNDEEVINNFKKAFKNVLEDLKKYEELKSLMGTPIKELMNELKELETVKAFVLNYTAFYDTGCCLDEYIYYDSEIGTLFKKWNDE